MHLFKEDWGSIPVRAKFVPNLQAKRSLPSSAEVKNVWSYTSTPPIYLGLVVRGEAQGTTLHFTRY